MPRLAAALAAVAIAAGALASCSHRGAPVGALVDVSGRILYVEAVDPDGDGDAHFVLLDHGSVSAPGITIVDVARQLRPQPLPGPGDKLTASGIVRPGSLGQRQVEATQVEVAAR